MSVTVISPHLDDAILSFGAVLPWVTQATVVTVFAGMPEPWSWPTPFDNAAGFDDSRTAVWTRRLEDREACKSIGARVKHLDFLDGQYGIESDFDDLVNVLDDRMHPRDDIAVPLGLAHPDHRLVAKACRVALARHPGRSFVVYADLPAAKLWPSHVVGALRGWERAGFELVPYELSRAYAAKQIAVECYKSQLRFPELAWENLTEERAWIVP